MALRDGSSGAPRTSALRAIHADSQARLSALIGPRRLEPALRSTTHSGGRPLADDMPLSLLVGFSAPRAFGSARLPAFVEGRLLGFAGLARDLLALFARHGDMRCFDCGRVLPKISSERLVGEIVSKLDSGVLGLARPLERDAFLGDSSHERLIVGASLVDPEALGREGLEKTLAGKEPVSLVIKTYSLPLGAESRLEIQDRIARDMRQPAPKLELHHFPRGRREASRIGSLGAFLSCSGCGRKVETPRTNEIECEACHGAGMVEGARCKACSGTGLEASIGSLSLGGLRPLDLLATSVATMGAWLGSLDKAADDPARSRSVRVVETLSRLGFKHHRLSLSLDETSDGENVRLSIALLALEGLSDMAILFEDSLCVFPEKELAAYWSVIEKIADENLILASTRSERVSSRADDVFAAVEQGGSEISLAARVNEPEHSISGRSGAFVPGAAEQIFEIVATEEGLFDGFSFPIPSGALVALSGETGSGKTMLLRDAIAKASPPTPMPGGRFHFEKIHYLGSEEGASPSLERTLAGSSGVFEEILEKLASSYEGRLAGFEPKALGRRDERFVCRECGGAGKLLLDAAVPGLSATVAACPSCLGGRYTSALLALKLGDRGLAEILSMTAGEARSAYWNEKGLSGGLVLLEKLGFGAVQLGKSTLEMSRSERQRLRLVNLLRGRLKKGGRARNAKPHLFLLDYPFAGMSTHDIDSALATFREGASRGDSFVLAVNDPDVIAACDLHYEAAVQVDRILPRAYTYRSQNRRSVVRRMPPG